MASELLDCTRKLRAAFRRLGLMALAQVSTGLLLLFLLLYMVHVGTPVLLAGLLGAAYGGRKLFLFARVRRSARQLRLEEEFIRHLPAEAHLRQCFRRTDHLWAASLILRSLRTILARPLPLLLTPAAKRERLARLYSRAFAPLHPPAFLADLLLLGAAIATGTLGVTSSAVAPPLLHLALAGTCAALVLELGRAALVFRLRRMLEAFACALGTWTLQEDFEEKLRPSEKPYEHRLLYEAAPWFTPPQHPRPVAK